MRRCRSVLVVVAVCGLLSGCWLQVGFDAGHSNANGLERSLTANNVAQLAQAWSTPLLQDATEPMVRGDRVYLTTAGFDAASGRSRVAARALRTTDGASLWTHDVATFCCQEPDWLLQNPATFVGPELWTGAFILYDTLPAPRGDFAAPVRLRPSDGSLLGEEGAVSVSPAVEWDDLVIQTRLETSPGRILAVRDLATHDTSFTTTLPGSIGLGPTIAPPAVMDDGLIVVADATVLSAVDSDGCGRPTCPPTWTLDLGAPLTTVATVPGSDDVFTIRGDDLVAVSRTGTISWTAPLGAAAPGLAIAGGTIYVAAGTSLQAFRASGCGGATCSPIWTKPLGATATSSPVVAGGVIYVGRTGGVEAFRVRLVKRLVTLRVAGTVDHLSVAGGRLFAVHRPPTGMSRLTTFAPAG